MTEVRKILLTILTTVLCTAILATAKAMVDVEKLKTRMETIIDDVRDIKKDVSLIKDYILKRSLK